MRALAVLLLASAAAACNVCSGTLALPVPVATVSLPGSGDFRQCLCEFTFEYSSGATLGKAAVQVSSDVASVAIFGGTTGTELPIIEFSGQDLRQTVFSTTGAIRIVFATGALGPGVVPVFSANLTAINQPPVLTEIDGLVDDRGILIPWGSEQPLVVTASDPDNNDLGMRAEVFLTSFFELVDTMALRMPSVQGVNIVEGAANQLVRSLTIEGPGSRVEAALEAIRIIPVRFAREDADRITVSVNDFGNSGEGSGPLVATYRNEVSPYPDGVIQVPRDLALVSSGRQNLPDDVDAVYVVQDAYRISFFNLDLTELGDVCHDFVRVYDGDNLATARLLSTELTPTGEMCGSQSKRLPTYTGVTGAMLVEVQTGSGQNTDASFEASVDVIPEGFQVWLLEDTAGELQSTGGETTIVPPIMVTGLPDGAGDVSVMISAEHGDILLEFAESYIDIIDATAPDMSLSLAFNDSDRSPMFRVGDALSRVRYLASTGFRGQDTIVVRASSGGSSATLEIALVVAGISINAPPSLSVNAFRVVPIELTVGFEPSTTGVTVTIATDGSGIGQVSLDRRAIDWLPVGYATQVEVTAKTSDEVNAVLASLVYRADLGGLDTLTITLLGESSEVPILVDPMCAGDHIIYGFSSSFTERAGTPSDPFDGDTVCSWELLGPSVLRFPFFEIPFLSDFSVQNHGGTVIYANFFSDPGELRSAFRFFVTLDALFQSGQGFVGVASPRTDGTPNPPLIVVPTEVLTVVVDSTTRLQGLFVDVVSYDAGPVTITLETTSGVLASGEAGSAGRVIELSEGSSFESVDAFMTGIDFLAGSEQTVVTIDLEVVDGLGTSNTASFSISVLPCSGLQSLSISEDDAAGVITVADGSGFGPYAPNLACEYRVTGATAPAVLDVEFLTMEASTDAALGCADGVTIYDGANSDGRVIGTFCNRASIPGQIVSQSGSFYLFVFSDDSEVQGDGFSFQYKTLPSAEIRSLADVPITLEPERTSASLVLLPSGNQVLVVGGFSGVPVSAPMLYSVEAGWQGLAATSGALPSRYNAAVAATADGRILVHGGIGSQGGALHDTWIGLIDVAALTVKWVEFTDLGPETSSAFAASHNGINYMADFAQRGTLYVLDEPRAAWDPQTLTGVAGPEAGILGTAAYSASLGRIFVVDGASGAVMALALVQRAWESVGATAPGPCSPTTCGAALLDVAELALFDDGGNVHSLNLTDPAWTPIGSEGLPSGSSLVGVVGGGQYFGRSAAYVFGSGSMHVLTLALGVESVSPQVAPTSGGTLLTISGERFSSCSGARCTFSDGAGASVARVLSERLAECTAPPGTASIGSVTLVCDTDDRSTVRHKLPEDFFFYSGPEIVSVSPLEPRRGATVTIELDQSAALLAAAEAPRCSFSGTMVDGQFDQDGKVRCDVPEDLAIGETELRVSLDGQQVTGIGYALPIASDDSSGGDTSVVLIVSVTVSVAVILLVFVVMRTRTRLVRVDQAAPWEIPFSSIEITETLGSGAYGLVYRGRFRGSDVAVKMSRDTNPTEDTIAAFRKESALMAELRHPNIVLFMGACVEPPNIAIVLEFMPHGSLFDLLHDDRLHMDLRSMVRYATDIAKGMAYLHAAEPPIIHRDLKSLNVLVDPNKVLKVSDFGMTGSLSMDGEFESPEDPHNTTSRNRKDDEEEEASGPVGSIYWMAPELLTGDMASTESDVYAYGVTLFEVFARTLPYDGAPLNLVIAIKTRQPKFRMQLPEELPPQLQVLVDDCCNFEPNLRPSFSSIREALKSGDLVMLDSSSTVDSPTMYSGSSMVSASGNNCVAVIYLPQATKLWTENPIEMRNAVEDLLSVVRRVLKQDGRNGFLATQTEDYLMCVLDTIETGGLFAARLQIALNQDDAWGIMDDAFANVVIEDGQVLFRGLRVSIGLHQGPIERASDPLTGHVTVTGPTVEQAMANSRRGGGGQILALSEVADAVNLLRADLVARPHSDATLTVMYPSSLIQRHEVIAQDVTASTSESTARAEWDIGADEIELGDSVGSGSYGTVFKGTWRGTTVACKELFRKKLARKDGLDLQAEVAQVNRLRHPNVVQFLGVARGAERILLVSEWMTRGSVYDAIVMARSTKRIEHRVKAKVARDIALGMRYLHEQNPPILHRSLTSHNVLLGRDWAAKVSDVGLTRVKAGASTMSKVAPMAHTAPEMLKGEPFDEASDVYALGILLWEMREQKVAFSNQKLRVGMLVQAVIGGLRPDNDAAAPTDPSGIVSAYLVALTDMMHACWSEDQSERPSMADIADKFETLQGALKGEHRTGPAGTPRDAP